jgi:hypothetical protein
LPCRRRRPYGDALRVLGLPALVYRRLVPMPDLRQAERRHLERVEREAWAGTLATVFGAALLHALLERSGVDDAAETIILLVVLLVPALILTVMLLRRAHLGGAAARRQADALVEAGVRLEQLERSQRVARDTADALGQALQPVVGSAELLRLSPCVAGDASAAALLTQLTRAAVASGQQVLELQRLLRLAVPAPASLPASPPADPATNPKHAQASDPAPGATSAAAQPGTSPTAALVSAGARGRAPAGPGGPEARGFW